MGEDEAANEKNDEQPPADDEGSSSESHKLKENGLGRNENDDQDDQDKDDEDESSCSSSSARSGMDWEALLKRAEAAEAELEEDLLPPIQHHINNLRKGKEVAKLASIRALPDMIDEEGDEAIDKLLPAVQDCLREESNNLDVHCEAAVVFKSILQNSKLVEKNPGLVNKLLKNIVDNVEQQRDNMSAAAWLETLVDISDHLSVEAIKTYVVPVAQQQTQPTQRVQRRLISTKLLQKLASVLPPNDVRKELGGCAQMLCQDPNANVRTGIAQRLAAIAKSLNNPSDAVSLLLPCILELVKDDDPGVKEAILSNLGAAIPHITKDAKKNTILPMIRRCTDKAVRDVSDILAIVARNLGEWAHLLKDVLDALDMSWVLNTYCKIVQVAQKHENGTGKQTAFSTIIRRACAYNFPCMLIMFPNSFERLLPHLETFCADADDEVRMAIAAAYHEIVSLHPDKPSLIPPFIELVRGGATEVVAKITFNLDKLLPLLYKCTAKNDSGPKITSQQLDRILIGCNVLLRSCGAWRSHEAYLRNLVVLTECLNYHQLFDTFVPILQREAVNVRANPCRYAAVRTLLLFMRQHPDKAKRDEVLTFLRQNILKHQSCYRRAVFLDVAECALQIFSRQFFKENLLKDTLSLTNDKVSNIRLRLSRLLPRIKKCIVLPDDDQLLLNVEKTVGQMLTAEESTHTRVFLQHAARDLSRTDSGSAEDQEDVEKVKEEDRLWNKERVIEKNKMADKPPSGIRPPSAPSKRAKDKDEDSDTSSTSSTHNSRLPSNWRMQRRAVAVVRPQPIVVMRSPSPVPSAEPRKSRLPLSSSSYISERSSTPVADRYRSTSRSSSSSSLSSRLSGRSPSLDSKRTSSLMSTSTPSCKSDQDSSYRPSGGLQRSSTSSSIGSGSYSSSSSITSYPLMSSRSVSQIRRPMYGLTRAARDLSRTDSGSAEDQEDVEKVKEEDRLWNKERVIEKNKMADKPPSGIRPPSAPSKRSKDKDEDSDTSSTSSTHNSRLPSNWRMQRRAVAVVRPQPIVVMRSPSPVPSAEPRKSRLPLSSSSYISERSSTPVADRYRSTSRSSSSSSLSSRLSGRSPSLDSKRTSSLMSTSTPSCKSDQDSSYRPSGGLQRSSTSSSIGSGSYSSSSSITSYPLMSSRSVSQIRRPMYGLTRVSSSSAIERKPPQMTMRIRTAT